MSRDPLSLLTSDALARSHGCGGLAPGLRAALIAGSGFAPRSAGPVPVLEGPGADVIPFPAARRPQ